MYKLCWLYQYPGSEAFRTNFYIRWCFLCIQVSLGNWGTKWTSQIAILSWKPWAYSDNLPVISKAQVDNQVNFVAQLCFVLPTLSTCLHPILVVSVEGICYKGACVILNCALVENNWSLLVTRPEKLYTDDKPTDGGLEMYKILRLIPCMTKKH